MTDEKRCTKCGEVKSLSAFHKDKRIKSGIGSVCLNCYSRYTNEYIKRRCAIDPEYRKHLNEYQMNYSRRRKPRNTCVVCGEPLQKWRVKYCAKCSPMARTCCDFLKLHHEVYKDDPERLSTDFIKNLMHCKCEVEK